MDHKASNCVMKLPVGYRFCPTDEELIEHYLKRKVFDLPLPASVIPHFDVFLTHPSALPGDLKEKRFFFSQHKSGGDLLRKTSVVGCGIWKCIGKEKLIGMKNHLLIGLRKSLVFYESKFSERATATRWVMHEYTLACSASPASSTTPNSTQLGVGDWAVYCLFQKRRRPKKQRVVAVEENGWDFPQPCSSCSSGVTEVSSDQEHTSIGLGLGLGLASALGFSSSSTYS